MPPGSGLVYGGVMQAGHPQRLRRGSRLTWSGG